ncbi:MAG: iron-sulfur cluster assembly scaffold protein, partial [Desulfatiglandaceae bacterium]
DYHLLEERFVFMGNQKPDDDIYRMLSESGYSDKAIEYFQERENIGVIEEADQTLDLTGPCGDTMKISMNIEGNKISDAKKLAENRSSDMILTDGPPGVGCPVIASIGGAAAVLIVAEPTVSGIHDMERVAQLAAHFRVPAMVCVNKFDLNLDQSRAIEKYAKENNLGTVGRIPFDPLFTKSMVRGQTIFEYNTDSDAMRAVKGIWQKTRDALGI